MAFDKMALPKTTIPGSKTTSTRTTSIGTRPALGAAAAILGAILGATLVPVAAQAQFFGWGSWGGQQQQQPRRAQQAPPSRGFFFPFFGRPNNERPYSGRSYYRPYYAPRQAAPPVESSRAPPPRHLATQPNRTVVVIGDSMADWLAAGLEDVYGDQSQTGIVRDIRPNSGLVHYEPRNDSLQWPQAIKQILADQKPSAIVVMLGLNDRAPLRVAAAPRQTTPANQPAQEKGKDAHNDAQASGAAPAAAATASGEGGQPAAQAQPGPGLYEFHTDDWAKLYRKRIDDMVAALKSKGVPVLWVGLPALRGPHATADMSYLDDLYRASADKAGIDYVDVWNSFVDENGRYTVMGPDFEGQIRRLRSGDGVHFTRVGALKLAHLVDQELSQALANPTPPPTPQAAAPAKPPGAAQPTIGPVVPLTAADGTRIGDTGSAGSGGQLLGGGSAQTATQPGSAQPDPAQPDSAAAAVLVRGDPPQAPVGRADNFAWPPAPTANGAAGGPKATTSRASGTGGPKAATSRANGTTKQR